MNQVNQSQEGSVDPFQALVPVQGPRPVHDEEAFSLANYLDILRRRKWWLVVAVVVAMGATAVNVATMTPLYRATAMLQVDPEEKLLPYEDIGATSSRIGRGNDDYLETQLAKLTRPMLAQEVVEQLDLDESEDFQRPIREGLFKEAAQAAWGGFKSLLRRLAGASVHTSDGPSQRFLIKRILNFSSTNKIRDTRLIRVSYTHPDRQIAVDVANTLAQLFVDEHIQTRYDSVTQASRHLAGQLEDLKKRLDEARQDVLDYSRQNRIPEVTGEENIARRRVDEMVNTLATLEDRIATMSSQIASVRGSSVRDLPDSVKDAGYREVEAKYNDVERRLAGLRVQYGEAWPAVRDSRLELEQLERLLQREKERLAQALSREVSLARAQRDKLKQDLEQERSSAESLNQESFEYTMLVRERDTAQEMYEGVLTRFNEALVAQGMSSTNIQVIEPALLPPSPFAPNKTRALWMALGFGLVAGLALAFGAEFLDNTLKSADDVSRYLGLPALGVVPHFGGERSRRPAFLSSKSKSETPAVPLLVTAGSSGEEGYTRALEAYRSLRTALLLSHAESAPRTILVTSALPGEGKSTTAANIAVTLARTGERTLLLDLDLRRPSLARLFRVSSRHGMSGFLSGQSEVSAEIVESGMDNLFLVTAGPPPPNPPELLGSKRLATGFVLLKDYFKYIVMDTPPVLDLSDALILSPHTDGAILVARGGRTPRQVVRKAAMLYTSLGGRLLGLLVNDLDSRKFARAYNSYYYGYESYYTSQP